GCIGRIGTDWAHRVRRRYFGGRRSDVWAASACPKLDGRGHLWYGCLDYLGAGCRGGNYRGCLVVAGLARDACFAAGGTACGSCFCAVFLWRSIPFYFLGGAVRGRYHRAGSMGAQRADPAGNFGWCRVVYWCFGTRCVIRSRYSLLVGLVVAVDRYPRQD